VKWIPLVIALVVGLLGVQLDQLSRQHRAEINALHEMIIQLQTERDSLRDLRETRDWYTNRWRSMVVANLQWNNFYITEQWLWATEKLDSFNLFWEACQ